MKIIHTNEINPEDLPAFDRELCYNGLDCVITAEVLSVLLPQLDNHTTATYSFSRSLQGPALEMRLRGVKIDPARRARVLDEYYDLVDRLDANLERLCGEGWGMWEFNWRPNSKDPLELFYNRMQIPAIKKAGRPTCDRDALEKLEGYFIALPIVRHIILLRDIWKKIQVLKTEIDPDGRMRTSYNIAGTNTGRFSSSFSEFGTGGNLQNIEDSLRSVFIADEGMKFGYFDGEQIQSRIVGAMEWNLFQDGLYLDSCESGDLHTTVAKLCWPELPWTGKVKQDKEIAEQPFYRHYTRRFMCKKIGHGTNFDGKAPEISRQTKIEQKVIEEFQPKYHTAFPAHRRWKEWTQQELIDHGYIVDLSGRKRYFFGRRNDAATVREALAYQAQATEAHIVNSGMLNVWRERNALLSMQQHDAVLIQFPEDREEETLEIIKKQLRVPMQLEHGREFIVPFGCKTGWNFGSYSKDNVDGLKDWEGGDERVRSPAVSLLDRVIRGSRKQSRKRGGL